MGSSLNSRWPSDTIWHHISWPILVPVMSYCLFDTRPLPEPVLNCELDPKQQTSVKCKTNFQNFLPKMHLKLSFTKLQPFCSCLSAKCLLAWWNQDIDGLMQERCYSIANAQELRLSCINASTWCMLWYQTHILKLQVFILLYMGQITKVGLSCYLVLLSADSKTR